MDPSGLWWACVSDDGAFDTPGSLCVRAAASREGTWRVPVRLNSLEHLLRSVLAGQRHNKFAFSKGCASPKCVSGAAQLPRRTYSDETQLL